MVHRRSGVRSARTHEPRGSTAHPPRQYGANPTRTYFALSSLGFFFFFTGLSPLPLPSPPMPPPPTPPAPSDAAQSVARSAAQWPSPPARFVARKTTFGWPSSLPTAASSARAAASAAAANSALALASATLSRLSFSRALRNLSTTLL